MGNGCRHLPWCWKAHLGQCQVFLQTFQVMLVVKNWPASAGDVRATRLLPGSGRSPGGGHGNPLQYSCLENPIDRGVWQATVHRESKRELVMDREAWCTAAHRVAKSRTRRSNWTESHLAHVHSGRFIDYFSILSRTSDTQVLSNSGYFVCPSSLSSCLKEQNSTPECHRKDIHSWHFFMKRESKLSSI